MIFACLLSRVYSNFVDVYEAPRVAPYSLSAGLVPAYSRVSVVRPPASEMVRMADPPARALVATESPVYVVVVLPLFTPKTRRVVETARSAPSKAMRAWFGASPYSARV
ncbi:hypothetical protein STANM309S_00388 [Streptomyces tanashiensis]